jgi:hypothetical protein
VAVDNKPASLIEKRDKYIADQTRELLFNMKEVKTPKGVWWSTSVMSFPLFASVGYLAIMSPMALNAAMVDPNTFAYTARSCLRLLSLNMSFLGGIHYGFASAAFDTARSEEEERKIS